MSELVRVLVYGPPAAGKSTRARALSAELGIPILEREHYGSDLEFRRVVAELEGDAIVIRCCFTRRELQLWRRMSKATRVVRVQPSRDQTREQALGRGTGHQLEAIDRWYRGWSRSW